MMALFVMLNFTSAGGVYRPDLQNGYFGALHACWNGAGFVEETRNLLYFDGRAGFGGNLTVLALWLVAGAALLLVAAAVERRRRAATVAPETTATATTEAVEAAEEEMEEAVGV